MAELLIYNKTNWMDKLTNVELEQKLLANPKFSLKYEMRYQKGDIVEVQEDGFWSEHHGWRKDIFSLVLVLGVPAKRLKYMMDSEFDMDGNIIKRRKYNYQDIIKPGITQIKNSRSSIESVTLDKYGTGNKIR